ncbi:ABC transporter permease [Chitinophaga horti]|uniref:ABC transporter permease n=1 Tax=Chitinophaga horti TaxID=2920382 RepID=A0ABY6J9A4_9BACT|nr:ABC transporter permease [Chitinophaga horti]UYQ94907.1 ABC transporter permease [Chitinophaga horti]
MLSTLKILWNSLKMALQELRVNKVRTFLSLLGITIGIFCVIAVFSATDSLERNIRNEVATLGSNVIYIQKMPWDDGPDMPWWKFVNRPASSIKELKPLQDRVPRADAVAFAFTSGGKKIEAGKDYMENVELMGVSQDFDKIQALDIIYGRYFSPTESNTGANVVILGGNLWQTLFPNPEAAIGSIVKVSGRNCKVIGLLKYKGEGGLVNINYDDTAILPYGFSRTIVDERRYADPFLMVKGKPDVSLGQLKDDLTGAMRAVRRLSPKQEDNFALNEITAINNDLNDIFLRINIGGLFIGIFALFVGAFGIANIMFVTVKERTNIIGLKKAIGAKRSTILLEFLLEAILLCVIGGLLGLLTVYGMAVLATKLMNFPFVLSMGNIIFGVTSSMVVGLLAGFIPAWSASRLDPVVAIRSN